MEGIKDQQTTTENGSRIERVPHGVTFYNLATHVDERGSLINGFNPLTGWHTAPIVYAYHSTLRPGYIKGWAMHKLHEDRYCILLGHLEVVLYDARPASPTVGMVARVVLSEHRRRLMNIPPGIWHADHNIGDKDVLIANYPTVAYDHADPDKYRLPLDTEQIPFRFHNAKGW